MAIMSRQQIPNMISIIRLLLIIPVAYFLLHKDYRIAFYFIIFAGISDGVDGFLARRYHWQSNFGAFVDPLADKLLMLVCYFSLAWLKVLPIWLVAIVVFRDLWLIGGVALYRCLVADIKFKPSRISKWNTVFQILLVIVILFDYSFITLPQDFITVLMYLVVVTTILSFIDYTWVWGKKALANLSGQRQT